MDTATGDLRDPQILDNSLDLLNKGYKLLAKRGFKHRGHATPLDTEEELAAYISSPETIRKGVSIYIDLQGLV